MGVGVSARPEAQPGCLPHPEPWGVPRPAPLTVLKLGSSVLASPEGFRGAAREVAGRAATGGAVLVVVSATRGTTDALDGWARALADLPPPALLARVLATGEAASTALLGIALAAEGVDARVLTADELAIETRGPLLDAEPAALDAVRLRAALEADAVVVAPGFVGVDRSGAPSLLGRGGSDLTALFLAHRLAAGECVLVKDVDGVYPADPVERPAAASAPYARATWEELLALNARVVQEKAVRFAMAHGLSFRVAALGGRGTVVGAAVEVAC